MSGRIGETGAVTTGAAQRGRTTPQGAAVEEVLADADAFLSAQDIYADLRDRGRPVGLATVYRHLQKLSERGAIDAVAGSDGQLVYRSCATEAHHHHLVCRSCHRSTSADESSVERWATRQAAARGYTDVTHTVELFGTCATCRGAAKPSRSRRAAS